MFFYPRRPGLQQTEKSTKQKGIFFFQTLFLRPKIKKKILVIETWVNWATNGFLGGNLNLLLQI